MCYWMPLFVAMRSQSASDQLLPSVDTAPGTTRAHVVSSVPLWRQARYSHLKPSALADALGQAGMQASGIWQCRLEPTFSKQLATAQAARSGVVSARLAKTGFPGAKLILEGRTWFLRSLLSAC